MFKAEFGYLNAKERKNKPTIDEERKGERKIDEQILKFVDVSNVRQFSRRGKQSSGSGIIF